MKKKFEVQTDHFQFYFGDAENAPFVDTSKIWEQAEQNLCFDAANYLVGVSTVRYGGATSVTVSLFGNVSYVKDFDHKLGDFTINVSSGNIVFWGPELLDLSHAPKIKIPIGIYLGAVYSKNTENVVDEMSETGSDEYLICIWPN